MIALCYGGHVTMLVPAMIVVPSYGLKTPSFDLNLNKNYENISKIPISNIRGFLDT